MSIFKLAPILGLIYQILNLGRIFLKRLSDWKRNKKVKDKYEKGSDAAKDGNLDELNDIFKGRKG